MKKAVCFILVIFTYYLAGMYRSLPLMALCIMELLLVVFLLLQSVHLRKKVSVRFQKSSEAAEEGSSIPCRITVENLSRLPVNQLAVRLRICYPQDRKEVREKLYAGGEQGESSFAFQISGKYCGLIQMRMDRLWVFDSLTLFALRKSLSEEMSVAVFPKEQAFYIEIPALERGQGSLPETWTINRQGDAYDEIRQIREYRNGDSNRHIHWNQSAKTENMWIKEYERETDLRLDIFIDHAGSYEASASELNIFYRSLSALMLGLLRIAATVRVHWYRSDKKCFVYADGSDTEKCRDILLQLYRTDFSQAGESLIKELESYIGSAYQSALRLTMKPALFRGNALICEFSAEKLDREIQEKILRI